MQEFTADQVAGEVPFKHTLDFEMTTVPNSSLIEKKASLLLELIAPRNPWVESESVLHPSQMYVPSPTNDQERLINEALLIYRAPFNRIPRFVEPGKVNVNTAAQESVFRGLMWSAITPAAARNTVTPIPFQVEFNKSRSNLSPSSQLPQPNPRLDGNIPTEFPGLMKSGFSTPVTYAGLQSPYNTVTTGLLRPDVLGTARLFATSNMINTGTSLPFNAFVTNQAVSRLANLTTDQSNVFAVRVTIGYFEYDAATGLGAEYGLEEGKARRHRAFYVIDRSVPVAYQEGQDLNTYNCILIRRIIE